MGSLSKKEIEEEIVAIKSVLEAHKTQVELNKQGIKVNEYILDLFEKKLELL